MRTSLLRYVWLAILGLLLLVACGEPSSGSQPKPQTSLPPPATATPSSVPVPIVSTSAVPTPRPSVPPAATGQAAMTKEEYAEACGELVKIDVEGYARFKETGEGGGPPEQGGFPVAEWVDSHLALRPPPELADFHEARVAGLTLQIARPGFSRDAYAAFISEAETLRAMPVDLQSLLLDESCLYPEAYRTGQAVLDAGERIANRGPASVPPTIEDYAARCGDVRMTVPFLDTPYAVFLHTLVGLVELTPPPELEQFHDYMIRVYRHLAFAGTDRPVPRSLIETGKEIVESTDAQTYSVLISTGCAAAQKS